MRVLETTTFRWVEKHFYMQTAIREALDLTKTEIQAKEAYSAGEYRGIYGPDPTAADAIKRVDPIKSVIISGHVIRRPADWLQIVHATQQHYLDTQIGILLERRYVSLDPPTKTFMRMGIDRTTYYDWRNEAIMYASLCACQIGLIKVF